MVPPGTTDGPSWDQSEKSTENKRLFRQNNPFFGGPSWDHCSVIHTLIRCFEWTFLFRDFVETLEFLFLHKSEKSSNKEAFQSRNFTECAHLHKNALTLSFSQQKPNTIFASSNSF